MEAKPVVCTIKPPMHIKIGDHKVDFHSGCSVIEVTFPNVFYVEVGEIHFKNYYTAYLSVKARIKSKLAGSDGGDMKWQTCLKRLQLMPHPHCDSGAEDFFTLSTKQMILPLSNITGLRFILRQPSPVWKEFKIDDIKLYKSAYMVQPEVPLPTWMNETKEDEPKEKQIKGLASIPALSRDVQQLWALTGAAASEQPRTTLGRYDVEGSYEINLLSYT